MGDLVRGPAPRSVSFAISLPHSLLATASLICAAPHFEGLGDWLREARALLPRDLIAELCLLVTFPGRYQRFTGELAARLPTEGEDASFEQMLDRLRKLSSDEYRQMALRALGKGSMHPPSTAQIVDLLEDPDAWAQFMSVVESEWAPETVADLVRDGGRLKQRVLTTLTRFWDECYADEYSATLPLMEHSVAYQRARDQSPRFEDLFVTVTGRLVPEIIAHLLDAVSSITFVPSCYVGPYVAYTHQDDRLTIYYNCRGTPVSSTDTRTAGRARLYPPLKALADETRLEILALLHGQERYAQEIVEHLGLSQPTVSRHLNLMATAGILSIRRDGSTKYYSINPQTLARLADALRTFL